MKITRLAAIGVALLGAASASCSDSTTVAPNSQNLNRPVDIAFACYGGLRITNGGAATATQPVNTTAQPVASCERRSEPRPSTEDTSQANLNKHRPPGQEDLDGIGTVGDVSWYALILESVPGTVAIARWGTGPSSAFTGADVAVLDADPLTPGKNAISVGDLPIAIAMDKSGCFAVTANAGSCDLSSVDVTTALNGQPAGPTVKRVTVKSGATTILAKPAAMVGGAGASVVGNACPVTPDGVVYVAYPACGLVAALSVEGETATIQGGVSFKTGAPVIRSAAEAQADALTCPVECGVPSGAALPGGRPTSLAFRYDARVNTYGLAIGLDKSATPAVTLATLDATSGLPTAVTSFPLETPATGALGVTSIALSPQIGMGGAHPDAAVADVPATSPGGLDETKDAAGNPAPQAQFIYAVATDGTVRVVDTLTAKRECDTQIDSRFIQSHNPALTVADTACMKLATPTDPTLPRRAGAKGPGIELFGETTGTTSNGVPTEVGTPMSVAFVTAVAQYRATSSTVTDLILGAPATAPVSLFGHYAVITSTNGAAFVVNVDDDNNAVGTDNSAPVGDPKVVKPALPNNPQGTAPTIIIPHQLRDNVITRDETSAEFSSSSTAAADVCGALGTSLRGGPRSTTAPSADASAGTFAGAFASAKVGTLPSILQNQCFAPDPANASNVNGVASGIAISSLLLPNTPEQRRITFPDLRSLADEETWTLTWEGALSNDPINRAIDGPAVRTGAMHVDTDEQAEMRDASNPFCGMGVEEGDVVQFRGCDPANVAACPTGYSCFVRSDSKVPVATAGGVCMRTDEGDRLSNACRDFLISLRRYTVAKTASDQLVLRPRKHVLQTTPVDGCESDDQCQALADYAVQNTQAGIVAAKDTHTWACMVDGARVPTATGKRCVQTCDTDASCDTGMVCRPLKDGSSRNVCMEGVIPPQACVNGPQRYEVRAGEAFALVGDRSGYVHPWIKSATSTQCVRDPNASLVDRGRLPLTAPACVAGADPLTGALPGGGFEPNPCATTVDQFDATSNGGDCTSTTLGLRSTPAIKLRTRGVTLTMVDPTYKGDTSCPLDRRGFTDPRIGAATRVPTVFPGYKLTYHISSGYTPLTLGNASVSFNPVMPVRVVEGPTHSIWVIDAGDYLSSSLTSSSTQGAVYRIESSSLSTLNLLN